MRGEKQYTTQNPLTEIKDHQHARLDFKIFLRSQGIQEHRIDIPFIVTVHYYL